MANNKEYTEWYERHEKKILEDFFTYLRFPSVSAQEKHKKDLLACADWLVDYLKKIGLKTELWQTPGNPVIFAERRGKEGSDTVLFYGHYDVQPPEPFEEWSSPPFEPEIRDGVIYARGAEDNKGQNFYLIAAIKAFLEKNPDPNLHIKIIIEGEEEVGSTGISHALAQHEAALKADHLLIVDMGMRSWEKPALTITARGIMTMEVSCKMMDRDVHSGAYGGIVYNPIRALAEVIALAIDEKGHVTIPGFYDDIEPLTELELKAFDLTDDPKDMGREVDLRVMHKTEGFSILEANYFRPTFEVNGIWGGYTGAGFKTVIPKEAHAKISCRLVPRQDPEKVYEQVTQFFRDKMPEGAELTFTSHGGGPAAWSSPHSVTVQIVQEAYAEILGSCAIIGGGGSIPITTALVKHSQAAGFTFMGTALDDDNIHAPDENLGLDQFKAGFLTVACTLERFNGIKKEKRVSSHHDRPSS